MYSIKNIIKKHYVLIFLFITLLLNGCTEGEPRDLYESLIVEFNDVQSISLGAVNTVITTGDDLQLTVTGTNSQAGTVKLTEYVSWSVSDDNLVRVKPSGLLESFSTDGTVTVTASLANFSDTIDITLSSAALSTIDIKADTATPDTLVTSVCRPLALKAFGNYDDASIRDITDKVNWSTSTAGAILNTGSLVSLSYYLSPGANIRAELETINSGDITVTVNDDISSMLLTPATVTLATGSTQSFEVLAVYGSDTDVDISATVDWASSDPTKAAFNNNDQVLSGIAQGVTTVTATCGLLTDTSQVTVEGKALNTIEITATDLSGGLLSMSTNTTYQLSATAHYDDGSNEDITDDVTWTATHPKGTVVTVSNTSPDKGQVTSNDTTDIDFIKIEYAGLEDQITVEVVP